MNSNLSLTLVDVVVVDVVAGVVVVVVLEVESCRWRRVPELNESGKPKVGGEETNAGAGGRPSEVGETRFE